MPIIGKPLLILGSLAGLSLLGTGGYFGFSHLASLNSQQPTDSSLPMPVDDELQSKDSPAPAEGDQDAVGGDAEGSTGSLGTGGIENTQAAVVQLPSTPPSTPPSVPLEAESSQTEVGGTDTPAKDDADNTRREDNSVLENQKAQGAISDAVSSDGQKSDTGRNDDAEVKSTSDLPNSMEDSSSSSSEQSLNQPAGDTSQTLPLVAGGSVGVEGVSGGTQLSSESGEEKVDVKSSPSEGQPEVALESGPQNQSEIVSGSTETGSSSQNSESTIEQSS